MTVATTLPVLMRRNAETMPKRPAMREKRRGIWHTFNWAQYDARVAAFARGLATHGFQRGERLAVLGDNRPQLYWALLAAQALGGVGVPLWPDADTASLAEVLRDAAVSVVVAEDQDQVEKLLAIRHRLPDLTLIVTHGPADERDPDARCRSFEAIVADGERASIDVAAEIARGRPDDPALLLFTTTDAGRPRGVLLSHANLIGAARTLAAAEDVRPTDDCLSFLPMAWIGDALYSTALGLLIGFTCNCPEDPETARRDLRELGPTILLAPPRIWNSLRSEIDTKVMQATPLKRRLFNLFRTQAERETPPSLLSRLLGEVLIHGPLRDQIGLRRVRWAHVAGGVVAQPLLRLFRGFGVNLKQSYGPAELSGIVALQSGSDIPGRGVGSPCEGIAMRIAPDGEVQVQSSGACLGYWRDEDATREAVTSDGWWRTGDAGRIDEHGHLSITGRLSEIDQLGGGGCFAPAEIENALRGSRFIADAVVPDGHREVVAALIVLDATSAANWARANGTVYTSMADLIAVPALRQLVREEVRACNMTLAAELRVRRFALLEGETVAGVEDSLSRGRQRRALMTANTALVANLCQPGGTTGVWAIDDVDGEVRFAREAADA